MTASNQDDILERLNGLIDVITRIAATDFSVRAPLLGTGDEVDAIAAGLNMLAEEIEAKFIENERLVRTLEEKMSELAEQHRTIMSLSTPSMLVWKGILVLPIIGVLNDGRAQKLSQNLLERIVLSGVDVVIIDVTGMAEMTLSTAKHLLDTFTAVRLLGAKGILTGLSSANARSVIELDIDMQAIAIRASLHEGLVLGFALTGRRVHEGNHARR
ncbi:MAG TPA: HAMP domain-containing protein [Polyangium sp.]|nr:HAMP domain-containing protein [Polyangium sp.]